MNRRLFAALLSFAPALGFGLPTVTTYASSPDAPAANPAAKAAVPLTLAPEKGLTVTAPGEATWDFGKRTVEPETAIVHTFILKNSGSAPLRIETLLTSCRCTVATLTLPPPKKRRNAPHGRRDYAHTGKIGRRSGRNQRRTRARGRFSQDGLDLRERPRRRGVDADGGGNAGGRGGGGLGKAEGRKPSRLRSPQYPLPIPYRIHILVPFGKRHPHHRLLRQAAQNLTRSFRTA